MLHVTYEKRLKPYEILMIAPSHGQIYQDPKFIMDAYTVLF
jgi:flavorubredoxin